MATYDEILSILNSSKKANELPSSSSLEGVDYVLIYNNTTKQTEKIIKEN